MFQQMSVLSMDPQYGSSNIVSISSVLLDILRKLMFRFLIYAF